MRGGIKNSYGTVVLNESKHKCVYWFLGIIVVCTLVFLFLVFCNDIGRSASRTLDKISTTKTETCCNHCQN